MSSQHSYLLERFNIVDGNVELFIIRLAHLKTQCDRKLKVAVWFFYVPSTVEVLRCFYCRPSDDQDVWRQ